MPAYADFIKERFERCLDLYLCPRTRRKRLFVPDAKALVPKLPKPRDLQPFPTTLALRYLGHKAAVSPSEMSLTQGTGAPSNGCVMYKRGIVPGLEGCEVLLLMCNPYMGRIRMTLEICGKIAFWSATNKYTRACQGYGTWC